VPDTSPTPPATHQTLHRIEVRLKPGMPDPRGDSIRRRTLALGLTVERVATAKVYLIEGALDEAGLGKVLARLLADPITETTVTGVAPPPPTAQIIEVHPQPGVMDPAAQSVKEAIHDLLGIEAEVSTGTRYDFFGVDPDIAYEVTERLIANPVIHEITMGPWLPASLPRGHEYRFTLGHIPLRALPDDELIRLSRESHLFLSLEEMQAIRAEFDRLDREPTDIELETLAQTWSEHCVHKTFKSTVLYSAPSGDDPINWADRPGHTVNPDGSITIDNLLKSTVAAATFELIADGLDWTLSVFQDNSGIVAFDDQWGACIKVETHNHPSALEPYGGAATGAGGCIRDIIGTGLGAKPIASTDVFCVAFADHWSEAGEGEEARQRNSETGKTPLGSDPATLSRSLAVSLPPLSLPPGTLHPRRILTDIVSGVRDYGNRMGIPTVNGAVHFDDRYVGNPLVFCGCIGLIPRNLIKGQAQPGDRIIALGGRTGRDGIHGATFSSAELESTHSAEFSHAVQIGNAIEEKRVLDAILRARDADGGPLFTAMTDCGAGGFSSAVGEMGARLGAEVHLDRAPLKYSGLSYTEVWISEAQERMVLAVPEQNLPMLRQICDEEHVELADLGHFGTDDAELVLNYSGAEVGRLSMHFLHEGIPTPVREATWIAPPPSRPRRAGTSLSQPPSPPPSTIAALLKLLSHPTISSKHWIIRQYDHEVQGNTVLKPLVGPGGRGPGDAAIIQPIPTSTRGIAIACGLQTGIGDPTVPGSDPYLMALAAVDECIRNLVCVGGNPDQTAILDNFCWPSCEKPENMGSLVRAAEGCYDAAKAYRTPFVSGKDSLNNQLRYEDPITRERRVIEVPPTLLITGLAQVTNINRAVTMDAKAPGNSLILLGNTEHQMGGSLYASLFGNTTEGAGVPTTDLARGPATARAVAQCITDGLVASAHDCSEGGLLTAVAEMLIATTGLTPGSGGETGSGSGAGNTMQGLAGLLARGNNLPPLGAELIVSHDLLDTAQVAFAETPSRYILEVMPQDLPRLRNVLRDFGGATLAILGTLNRTGRLVWKHGDVDVSVDDLAEAWLRPLDW